MTFAQLYETSARENVNVEEMFRAVTKLVLRSKRDQESGESRAAFYSVPLTFLEFAKKKIPSKSPFFSLRRWTTGGARAEGAETATGTP